MNLYRHHTSPKDLDLHDEAHAAVPKLVWEKYGNKPEELKKREGVLAKDPQYAYLYAFNVLKGPFPKGEDAIAKDAASAYQYARYVLKGPFPKGEAVIIKDPQYAKYYQDFKRAIGSK